MREMRREVQGERKYRFARFEDLSSTPNPLFLDCSTLSRVSTVARHLLALCPWRKGKSERRWPRIPRGTLHLGHSILRFIGGGEDGCSFISFTKRNASPFNDSLIFRPFCKPFVPAHVFRILSSLNR